jgi:hypothetical protein
MRTPCSTLLAVLFVAALLADCRGEEPGKDDGSLTGIVLIGVQTDDAPKDCSIQLMSREGKITSELVRHESRSIYPGGRVSRQGDRVAYCLVPEEGGRSRNGVSVSREKRAG